MMETVKGFRCDVCGMYHNNPQTLLVRIRMLGHTIFIGKSCLKKALTMIEEVEDAESN